MTRLNKAIVIIGLFSSLGSFADVPPTSPKSPEVVEGELSGPRRVQVRSRAVVLEYLCTALASDESARTVKMWLKPKTRSVKVFLGDGVTVEGTASRTRVPVEDKVYYSFPHGLEKYPFQLTFYTNRLGDDAELRLVHGQDAIRCKLPVSDALAE